MDRIYDSGTSASPPTMPASPSNGYPIKGNPSTGQPATKPGPYWYHAVTEELLAVQALAGLPNSGSTLNQVATAIATLQRQQTNTAYTTGGTAPAFTVTLPASAVALAALNAGLRLRLKFHAAGAGNDTLAIGSLAAKSLKQYTPAGNKTQAVIAANQLVDIEFDGADFVLLDPLGGGPQYVATPNIAITTALTAAHAGRLLNLQGTPGTVTLPAANSVPVGTTFSFWSQDNTWTVAKQSADFINTGNGAPATISLPKGDTLLLVSDGNSTWIGSGGSALSGIGCAHRVIAVANRAANTWYTNTTGKVMTVNAQFSASAPMHVWLTASVSMGDYQANPGYGYRLQLSILPGESISWSYNAGLATPTLNSWVETY